MIDNQNDEGLTEGERFNHLNLGPASKETVTFIRDRLKTPRPMTTAEFLAQDEKAVVETIFLVRSGVPYDVALGMESVERLAWCAVIQRQNGVYWFDDGDPLGLVPQSSGITYEPPETLWERFKRWFGVD